MSETQEHHRITTQLLQRVQLSDKNRVDRFLVPILLGIGIAYSALQFLSGDIVLTVVSAASVAILLALSAFKPLQNTLLKRDFTTVHAFYIGVFWFYSIFWVVLLRQLEMLPSLGKDSRLFYVLMLFFLMVTYRVVLSLFALTRLGYDLFFSKIPYWERISITINEFISAGMLSYFLGGELARLVQPTVLTVRVDLTYTGGVLLGLGLYYLIIQMMWIQSWNDALSKNRNWVRLARLCAPIALIVGTTVIARHFARLSDPRTADLLGTANLDQTILALSPIIWLMIFAIVMLVYTSSRGLQQRFLPQILLDSLPNRLKTALNTISDMDILLIVGLLSTWIPAQVLVFDDDRVGLLDALRQQIAQQNALIDTSEQALALIFSLPFYFLAVTLLILYASALSNTTISAKDRDSLVNSLPIGLLIVFIITLYLCAIPFSQVLSEGKLPQLPQDLGRILAFDVFIPLVLLYAHYFILVRFPYGRGQSRWRKDHSDFLQREESRLQSRISMLDLEINRIENRWMKIRDDGQRIDTLYNFVDLNGKRDTMNMELLGIIRQRQELDEVSETPVSVTIARLPTRIISIGIPLLLAFKVYEWAVVNNGLREIANNPNIGVIEFFQIILQQAQF